MKIAMLMGYEVLVIFRLKTLKSKHLSQKQSKNNWLVKNWQLFQSCVTGIGMVDGLLSLVPAAKVGHIGMYRDEETLQPVEYLVKLPEDIDQRQIFCS